ncbi:TetR/AcrR family transcriptional regulator [Acidimicrobiia bacterium EGI L10123]|uniref:TetR/AcrR family transcriptional regulator n=1 Tax=Salinilacustrithrix flava TaxID=2957203 RepID=UPI003D7C1F21|nr:TetR/AcrR family transcriptional regulator [Acidimicrobiia bacterium EGI L10123]
MRSREVSRRDEIVRAATLLFHKQGYGNTTTQQIADKVGMLKGSLYHHFRSKADLLFLVIEQLHSQYMASIDEDLAIEDVPVQERLDLFLDRHLDIVFSNIEAGTIYRDAIDQLEPAARRQVRAERDRYVQHMEELIRQGQDAGVVCEDVDASLLALVVLSIVNAPVRWFSPRGRHTADEVKAGTMALLRTGALRSPPAAQR